MYKLHSLQHPDWHRTGTSYCYCYIIEIIHHDIVLFLKSTRPSLPLKKETFESLRLPLAKGSSTSNQAFLLRRKDVNRPPVLGTAALYGWRTIKGLRHVLRDGTAWGYWLLYRSTAPFGTFMLNSIPTLPSFAN